ncbi:hypothetical protein UPYG_G00009670 [Umbra pygmaea]|uniref:protein-tyrosine-phosphatase n=1 Tax=Umbra pygmaea TaxID=75934 RepID=A0ABD0Y5L3_UMBPY
MEHLSRFVEQMSLADDSVSSEYTNIRARTSIVKKHLGLTTEAGALKDNVKKNRYRDILPYDQTRVPITMLTEENGSDYINANFIKGATKSRKYIATQGPLRNTLVDFWQMLWQYDVKIIVMACREFEMGKKKCERYWANREETLPFGPFMVSNHEEYSPNEEVVVRTLTVRYLEETRTVSQFQYTAWPDHDIPNTAKGILGLMDMARTVQGNNTSPVVIHCSAGCGRTGVICVLDYVHDLLVTKQINEDFSIMEIVEKLRGQRPSAVQTKEQYQFLFSAVAYMFEKALHSQDTTYQTFTKINLPICGDVKSVKKLRSVQPTERQSCKQKMNDTYAVVNKPKQLPPQASSTGPPDPFHHYDNVELGSSTFPLYSSVKPKNRCPPVNSTLAASHLYDTARPANQSISEASSVITDEHLSSTDDDYEYVLNPVMVDTNSSSPGNIGFKYRVRKPKGPRDPPAEWRCVER